ncbi:hypothetical protein pdam_00023731 [Pocillopora damicornis]|uniref:Uncharacterized protein n=1 Tax=Pocillopora damicornis TaxID=46731 RepID=A0A3M6T7J7_POCDA|nr:hypothetical protein pdam_00023731 [Pocillopora damicornis]
MYDSGILEDALVSDRVTVELIVREEQSYTKTSLGDAQKSGKSEEKILGVALTDADMTTVTTYETFPVRFEFLAQMVLPEAHITSSNLLKNIFGHQKRSHSYQMNEAACNRYKFAAI